MPDDTDDLAAAAAAAWDASAAAGSDAPEAAAPLAEGAPDPAAWAEDTGWSREVWETLPAQARSHAREVAQARRAAEARAAAWDQFEEVLAPRREALRGTYGSEAAAVRELFSMSDFAARDFPGFVRWLAQSRGVDPRSLLGAEPQSGEAPALPDASQEAERYIARHVERVLTEREVDAAFRAFEANEALEFRADPAVRQIMAGLLQAKAARTYADAYEMAVKAHPVTAAKLAEKAAAAAREEAARNASAKASAAVSVRGAPGTSRPVMNEVASEDIEATIARAWDAHVGGRV